MLAITSGSPNSSPMASFESANTMEDEPATSPPTPIAERTDRLGAAATVSATWSAEDPISPLLPAFSRVTFGSDETPRNAAKFALHRAGETERLYARILLLPGQCATAVPPDPAGLERAKRVLTTM